MGIEDADPRTGETFLIPNDPVYDIPPFIERRPDSLLRYAH